MRPRQQYVSLLQLPCVPPSGQRVFTEVWNDAPITPESCFWFYGPGTRNRQGDFWADGYYVEPAGYPFDEVVGSVHGDNSYGYSNIWELLYDTEYSVDHGL